MLSSSYETANKLENLEMPPSVVHLIAATKTNCNSNIPLIAIFNLVRIVRVKLKTICLQTTRTAVRLDGKFYEEHMNVHAVDHEFCDSIELHKRSKQNFFFIKLNQWLEFLCIFTGYSPVRKRIASSGLSSPADFVV